MAKLDIDHHRAGRRDPRAEEPDPPSRPGALAAPPSPSHDVPGGLGTPSPEDPFGVLGCEIAATFLVESVVAHGGFAVVYRARHLRFAAPVALKCLKIPSQQSASERAEFLERFQKEGEVMFRLSGSIPEVVRPLQYDSFKLPDGRLVPFIALEWLDGITLKDVIVKRLEEGKPPLSLAQGVTFLTPVARALSRAHHLPSAEGPLCILHCDLKPDNVFVIDSDAGESLRIFDFGISKVRHAATRQVGGSTTDGQAGMFTPAYAAPEQWSPERFGQTGPWTDVFALALTLTEIVTQKPAIDGAPTVMLGHCINEKIRPTPRRLGLAIPDRLENIFLRALAVDPRTRYQSIPKFWGDLEEALGLPATVGETARRSQSLTGPRLDAAAAGAGAALASGGAPAAHAEFSGELELALPSAPVAPPPAAPGAGVAGFGAQLEAAPSFAAPSSGVRAVPAALEEAPPAGALASFELADGPPASVRAAHPPPSATPLPGPPFDPRGSQQGMPAIRASQHGMPAVHASQQGMPAIRASQHGMPAVTDSQQGLLGPPAYGPDAGVEGPPSVATRERLHAAAAKAGQVASVAAVVAASAAKQIATKALEVDERHRIQLDQPATWIKPMMGPIVAMGAALVISIAAVFINKASGSNVSVVWISLPLMLASIGFAIYRWNKITKE